MDPQPIKTFIAYLVIWGAWLYTHNALLKRQEREYAIKFDDITYNNVSSVDFPIGIGNLDYTMM